MWADEEPEDDRPTWSRRVAQVAAGVVVIGGVGAAVWFIVDSMSQTHRHAIEMVTRITLPPPPPPPPPPKPPEPPKVEQPKIQEPKLVEKKPEVAKPKPAQPPASPLTAAAGSGANPYGLQRGDGSGNVIGGGGGDVNAAYQSYGRTVSADVEAALRRDDQLRFAKFVAELRIWLDSAGRVTRVQMTGSSGDPSVDSAVERALSGLPMHEPPPKDMPQPILLRTKSEPG